MILDGSLATAIHKVVLLGADSERAIRVTHPNYFDDRPLEELLELVG